jgi:mono/diheme cytochrome c family protein
MMARDLRRHLPSVTLVVIVLLLLAALAAVFIYAGFYNIGADSPHSKLVFGALEELRDRSVANHARNVTPPADLNDAKRIAAGAVLYNEMCTGCHLGPGLERSELSQGLYPSAPELARGDDLSPAEQFWVIKHGVKLTAMPAWGKTHDDQLIWNMVAFIRQLPKMSAQQYKATVASAPEDHDEMMKAMHDSKTP